MIRSYTRINSVYRLALIALLISSFSLVISSQSVPVRKVPDFASIDVALKELVKQEPSVSMNVFYVSPAKLTPSSPPSAWVYWPAKKVLILMEPGAGYDPKFVLVWSRRFIHLKKDVVPTIKDIGGSNFLLSKAEANAIVASCESGDKFVIENQF